MKLRTPGTWLIIGAAALAAALLVFCRPVARELVYPVEKLRLAVKRRLVDSPEVSRLKRDVETLGVMVGELELVRAENERLRTALGYAEAKKGEYLAAEVLSRDASAVGMRDIVRVGKGSLAGVKEGAVVVTPGGLAGKVVSTTLHTSEVALITDPGLKVSAYVEMPGGSRVHGVLAGGTAEVLNLRYLIGRDGELPVHSRVLTSGLGGVFPGGIMIGELISGEGEVRPAVDFSNLEDVFIRCEN